MKRIFYEILRILSFRRLSIKHEAKRNLRRVKGYRLNRGQTQIVKKTKTSVECEVNNNDRYSN